MIQPFRSWMYPPASSAELWARMSLGRPRRSDYWLRAGLAPLLAALVVEWLTPSVAITDAPLAVFLAFSSASLLTQRHARWAPLLPLMGKAWKAAAPLVGFLLCALLKVAAALPFVSFTTLAIAAVAAAVVAGVPTFLIGRRRSAKPRVRTAVIGSAEVADMLEREVELAGVDQFVVVGRISPDPAVDAIDGRTPLLGDTRSLARIIADDAIDLLVITGEVPRQSIFGDLASSDASRSVRVWELAGFCEEFFGHVPMSEIDATWFGYVMHPKFRQSEPPLKRMIDVVIASIVGLALLPVVLVLALIIRRDGGPAMFHQERIGENGRPFTLHKLRSMTPDAGKASQWSTLDDPRVTRIGRFLRRTHLDELPQVINVLRGEMSLVGPRPEVPGFVEHLERHLEFYPRRHLVRPGVTGWAQVRCGYAGSDIGSAWKLCHDLYYVKHRSLALDLMILGETLRMLFVEPHDDRVHIGPWVHRLAPMTEMSPAQAQASTTAGG